MFRIFKIFRNKTMTPQTRALQLRAMHGNWQQAGDAIGITPTYLRRIANDGLHRPRRETLRKMGLREKVTYELIGGNE